MVELFKNELDNDIEVYHKPWIINQLKCLNTFSCCQLNLFDGNIHDSNKLETIMVKDEMMFFGKLYLYKINKSPKMFDENYDNIFHYISISGIFDTYSTGNIYKKYYINES